MSFVLLSGEDNSLFDELEVRTETSKTVTKELYGVLFLNAKRNVAQKESDSLVKRSLKSLLKISTLDGIDILLQLINQSNSYDLPRLLQKWHCLQIGQLDGVKGRVTGERLATNKEVARGSYGNIKTINPGGCIDSARFAKYDKQRHVVTIRVDDSHVPEFYIELDIPLTQLEEWITLLPSDNDF